MTQNLSVEQRTDRAATILQKCVPLIFRRHYLGNNRKVDVDDLVEASGGKLDDDAAVSATKKLIDPKYISPVRAVQRRAKKMLRSMALPSYGTFGESSYLVPNGLARIVNDKLNAFADELRVEATKLATVHYRKAIEEQKAKLGPHFKQSDYVEPRDVIAAFSIEWRFVSFKSPENLETIDHALAEEADRKYQAQLSDAYDEVVTGLRTAALEIVADLADRLGKDETGKPRVIRSTALDAIREFGEMLPKRNVGGDDKLAKAIDKLVKRASGLTAEQLRDDESLRNGLAAAVDETKKTLAGLVKSGPRRGIRLPGAA